MSRPVLKQNVICMKYAMLVVLLLFLVAGVGLVFVETIVRSDLKRIESLVPTPRYALASLVIVAIVILVVVFVGCSGLKNESYCTMLAFISFVVLLFVIEILVALSFYKFQANLEEDSTQHMNDLIKGYSSDNETRVTVDDIQTDLKCCGANSTLDWYEYGVQFPASCCDSDVAECLQPDHDEPCFAKARAVVQTSVLILIGTIAGLTFLQLLGIVMAFALARNFKRAYAQVAQNDDDKY